MSMGNNVVMIHTEHPSYAYINLSCIKEVRQTIKGYQFWDGMCWWNCDEYTYWYLQKMGVKVSG